MAGENSLEGEAGADTREARKGRGQRSHVAYAWDAPLLSERRHCGTPRRRVLGEDAAERVQRAKIPRLKAQVLLFFGAGKVSDEQTNKQIFSPTKNLNN